MHFGDLTESMSISVCSVTQRWKTYAGEYYVTETGRRAWVHESSDLRSWQDVLLRLLDDELGSVQSCRPIQSCHWLLGIFDYELILVNENTLDVIILISISICCYLLQIVDALSIIIFCCSRNVFSPLVIWSHFFCKLFLWKYLTTRDVLDIARLSDIHQWYRIFSCKYWMITYFKIQLSLFVTIFFFSLDSKAYEQIYSSSIFRNNSRHSGKLFLDFVTYSCLVRDICVQTNHNINWHWLTSVIMIISWALIWSCFFL